MRPAASGRRGPRSGGRTSPTPLSLGLLALLSPVFAAFALVLFAGCANVSSVMLARAVARQREIAVRLSLGASRGRIVRQLLTEGLLIAVMAALVSLALTAVGLRVGVAIFFGTLPPSLAAILRTAPLAIDHRVFLFALAAAVASTLAFALVPALQASRTRVTGALGAHGGGGRSGARLRGVLVAGQVAISLLLVVPALTLARNGAMMRGVDSGSTSPTSCRFTCARATPASWRSGWSRSWRPRPSRARRGVERQSALRAAAARHAGVAAARGCRRRSRSSRPEYFDDAAHADPARPRIPRGRRA